MEKISELKIEMLENFENEKKKMREEFEKAKEKNYEKLNEDLNTMKRNEYF